MHISELLHFAENLFFSHRLIGVGILAIVIVFAVKKPVAALKLTLVAALLFAGFYVFNQLGNASFHGLLNERHGVSEMNTQIEKQTR